MKKQSLLKTILVLTIVVTVGFGLGPTQMTHSAYAFLTPKLYTSTPWIPIPAFTTSKGICQQTTYPTIYLGGSPIPTYTDTTTFLGSPWIFTGWCVADSSDSSAASPCYVYQGIAYSGRCETVMPGYNQSKTSSPNIPTEEWFHLGGVTLAPRQFLDVADTTPWETTRGHMATVIPCDANGTPKVRLYEGIIDGGVFTMEAAPIQYLQQLSDTAHGMCVYHFNVGADGPGGINPDGVTDYAFVNVSKDTVVFTDRNTSTFSIAEGFDN
ncbi:MAG: hypothetical protein ACREBB_05895 [Nitrosotalea sp.]